MSKRKKQRKKKRKQAWRDVDLARALVEYGKSRRQPEAIALAGQMLQQAAGELGSFREHRVHGPVLSLDMPPDVLPEEEATSEKEFEGGVIARGGPSCRQVSGNRWQAVIGKGESCTIRPYPEFSKKAQAVVKVRAAQDAYLFVYWRRVDMKSDPNDFKAGKGNVTAKWRTGISKAKWVIEVENQSGPDGLPVTIETSTG